MQDDEFTPYRTGADEVSAPVDLNAEQPVQHFAFGGIANPGQRPFLRGSDRGFLEARQKELDEFEQQRQAYNTALQDWQTNVYNPYVNQVNAFNAAAQQYNKEVYDPYKAQVDAYNAALQQYNKEVYDPYASQYTEYEKAINAYNAGDRMADYTGPAAPTLARSFDMTMPGQPKPFEMTAPTAPADFSMAAPVLPFKEEDVVKYQQESAARARRDAGNRAVAIDVVSDPDRFNFGSMSIANRFMAKGGSVEKDTTGQARKMMDDLSAPEDDAALMRMLDEITSKGKLSKDQVLEAVDRVAAAGRGGDELLAYLSPESVAVLKKMGGAGTINPATGLPEFKGGILGSVGRAVKRLFGRGDRPAAVQAEPQAERVPVAPQEPVAPVEKTPSAADLMKQLDEANAARAALQDKYDAEISGLRSKYDTDLSTFKTQAQKDQEAAIAAALRADAENRAKVIATPVIGQKVSDDTGLVPKATATTPTVPVATTTQRVSDDTGLVPKATTGGSALTPAIARDLMQRSMTTGVPTAEFDKYGGYGAVSAMYNQSGGSYDPTTFNRDDLQRYATTVAQTGVGNLSVLGQTGTPITAQALENMRRNGIDPATIANAAQMYSAQALAGRTTRPTTPIPGQLSLAPVGGFSSPNLSGGSATGVAAYGGVKPLDMSAFFRSMPGANWGSAGTGSGPRTTDQAAASSTGGGFGQGSSIPFQTATNAGQPGGIGTAINIVGPAMPGIGAVGPVGTANQQLQAIRPSNFFAQNQGASQGMMPGTVSTPYNPMAQYQGPSPLAALAANPNLAPGMLGGFQNAGMMVDRLGNRIYAPGMPPPGFADGGFVVGGGSENPRPKADPPVPTQADRDAFYVNRNDTLVQTRVGGSIVPPEFEAEKPVPPDVMKDILDKMADRYDPMTQEKFSDQWKRLGITDPLKSEHLQNIAQGIYNKQMVRDRYGFGENAKPLPWQAAGRPDPYANARPQPKSTTPKSLVTFDPTMTFDTGTTSNPANPGVINPVTNIPVSNPDSVITFNPIGSGNTGTVGTASQLLNNQGYFNNPTGMIPGTVGLPYDPLAQYQGPFAQQQIANNPNLTPQMLGGINNAGYYVDRLGNRIYSPGTPPPGFAKGGQVDIDAMRALVDASNMADEDEGPTVADYASEAKRMLASIQPTAQTPKMSRTRLPGSRGGAESPKEMGMQTDALATPAEYKPKKAKSAQAELRALAKQYALKQRAAENQARGLMQNTLGAPTLEQPTLTQEGLRAKRFQKGGEAKKADAGEVKEPSLFGVSSYATKASARMFPDQLGQDDQRDAARHMLAAATITRKYGPKAAELLGKAHEYTSNPHTFFSAFGVGKARDDLPYDLHNNQVGVELAARAKSQAELEKLVEIMARQAQFTQTAGKPWIMSREQMQERERRFQEQQKQMDQPPEYRHGGAVVHRAEGSPEEGEVTDAEREAASRPAFVTPKSGKGRKEGSISKALRSGEAYTAMAKGVTELPYNLAGAPVDLATMALRPFGYSVDRPVMGSDFIKEKMTKLGVRPEPPSDPTQKGFFTAGELLSNLTNPAGVARKAGPVVEKGVTAGAREVGRQLDRAIMDNAGPLANIVPQAAKPLYAVRPEGSSLVIRRDQNPDWVGQLLDSGVRDARDQLANMTHSTDRAALMENFWNNKAANYFAKQFGTESDPVYRGIRDQTIKSPILGKDFPDYVLDQLPVGKTRVNAETGESRFFPKYPAAYDAMRKRYDDLTQIRGAVPVRDPASVMSPDFTYSTSRQGDEAMEVLRNQEIDKMIAQGTPVSQATPMLEFLTRSVKAPETTLGPYNAKSILTDYEAATGTRLGDPNFQGVPQPNVLPQNLRTAFDKGEIMYGTGGPNAPLRQLFDTRSINEYLATLPERELKNLRFEDAVKGGAKVSAKRLERETLDADIRAGKRVPDKFFSEGVSAPLVQFQEGPLAGFSWKRIEKADATVPEGAYVGHSVGGYAQGGAYGPEKHRQFNEGLMRVYTLRDNRNRPVNTIEVSMENNGPVVTQIKGNGRATGNTAPEKYDQAVMQFLQDYLKPVRIRESDNYLTPLLQSYKEALRSTPSQP